MFLYFQTLTAITHVSKEIVLMGKSRIPNMEPLDSKKMLVLSLGTGIPKQEEKYTAKEAARWGMLGWIFSDGSTPLIDAFQDASSDMVDIHVSTMFQALSNEQNYLRIQVYACMLFHFEKGLSNLNCKIGVLHMDKI